MKIRDITCTTTAMSLIMVLLLGIPSLTVAQKYDKFVNKVNAAYKSGDYIKARKFNQKLKKKVTKKLGSENNYMVEYYYMEARNKLANGLINEFNPQIFNTIELSEKVNSLSSKEHVRVLNKVSQLLLQDVYPAQAKIYVDLADSILQHLDNAEDLRALTDINKAAVLSSQGYYAKAIEFIDQNEKHFAGRAIDRETYIDPKSGKLRSRKLPENEAAARMDDYARLINLKSNTYRNMGNFNKADSAFLQASDWISNNLGKNNIRYIQNALWHGQMLDENGINPKVTRKKYEDALSRLKRDHNESHYLGLKVYESLLNSYLVNNDMSKFKNLKAEYERVIKKYFSKNSVNYIKLDAIDFNARLDKDKTKNIENKALQLLATTTRMPEFHNERIKLLNFAYQAALINKTYANAEGYLKDILKQKKHLFGEHTPEYSLTKTETANFLMDFTDEIDEAGKIYDYDFKKVVEPEIAPAHIIYVRTLNHLAKYYESTDNLSQASKVLQKALQSTQIKYDNQDYKYGEELVKIASLQIKIGEFDGASKSINNALSILEHQKRDKLNVIYYVKALETNAKLNELKGEFDDAKEDLEQSQKLLGRAQDLTNYDDVASAINLADVYIKFGRISQTETLLGSSIAEYEKLYGANSRNLIPALLSSGNLKLFTGEYTEAEKIARRALNISLNIFGENSTKTAYSHKLLAQVYTSIGDYEKAEQNIADALKVQEEIYGHDHIEVAKSLSQLGLIRFYKGDDPTNIEEAFDDAKRIIAAKLGDRTPMYADVLRDISMMYIKQSRFDDAFNALSLAESIWKSRMQTKRNVNVASIYMLIGDVYYQQKDYQHAEEKYDQAKKLYERFFSDEHPEYVRVLSKLSKVYYMQGDKRKAKKTLQEVIDKYDHFIKTYFPALSEREKAKFWNTIKSDYEFYNTIALRFKDEDPGLIEKIYNNALTTKAILLSSSIKIRERILNGNDEELKSLYNEWLSKKEFLTTVLSMRLDQLSENDIDPLALSDEVEQLEKELSEKSEIFGQNAEQSKITWQNVQSVLKPNEVAIEMVRFRYFDHIFTDSVIYAGLYVKNIKSQKKPGVFVIRNGRELENKYFKVYRNSIIYKVRDRFSDRQYWQPIVKAVGPTSTIYLSADGVYNQINLEAIPTVGDKYVLDDSNIVLVSNTKDIYLNSLKKVEGTKAENAALFGNPIYYLEASSKKGSKINQLPGTELEVKEIDHLFENNGWKTKVDLEKQATESAIKSVDNPRIFHIATHGFFTPEEKIPQNALEDMNEARGAENPLLRTGLLMAGAGDLLDKTKFNYNMEDGILTAYEAMSMNLEKTDLVVLSACETGLGELEVGEGVYGLQRAFLVAGAQTLIMSMFKVNDEATQKLMSNFYSKWLATGKKRQSFLEAKKELRNEYKDPIYWGAFIMIGLE